jgi:glutaconate CoA-transferase subunit A
MREKLTTLAEATAIVEDGMTIAMAAEGEMAPMALVRELIRAGRKDLRLLLAPGGGLAADVLLGAGCVSLIEASNVEISPFGYAPHFRRQVQAGEGGILDSG